MWRVVLIGAIVALVLVGGVVAAALLGVLPVKSSRDEVPQKLLVILTAPDKDATQVAALPLVVQRERGTLTAQAIDPETRVQVSGTSAETLAEAYPFGGGNGVAAAYQEIAGGDPLDWVVVPPGVWTTLVDSDGGIDVDVPAGVSAYTDGQLTVLEPGSQRLSGAETLALVSSLEYLDVPARVAARTEIVNALIPVVTKHVADFDLLVRKGSITSSLAGEDVFSRIATE